MKRKLTISYNCMIHQFSGLMFRWLRMNSFSRLPVISLLKTRLVLFFACFIVFQGNASDILAQKISIKAENISLTELFMQIHKQTQYDFVFAPEVRQDVRILDLDVQDQSLKSVLDQVLRRHSLTYEFDNQVILIKRMEQIAVEIRQQKTVVGRITDPENRSLPGVNIREKSTENAVVSDEDGNYVITMPAESGVLAFSLIGFQSQEVRISTQTVQNIILEPTVTNLEDVVVIAYGTTTREDLTGSVGQVKMADVLKAPVGSFDQALAGRVAGVQVSSSDGQPGLSSNIVIRGANSLTQSNAPLYVIDGFPIEDPENAAINPEEIESMNILKDASATAIYGSRGANGVIIIETKKGQAGKPVITLNSSFGFQELQKKMEMMNPYDFVRYQLELNELTAKRLYTPSELDPTDALYDQEGRALEDYRNISGTRWQDLIFQTSPMHIHNIAVRGGNSDTKYAISGSLFNQQGIVINTGAKRYQGRVSIDQTISDKVDVGLTANYSQNLTNGQRVNEGGGNHFTSYLLYRAWAYRPVSGNPDVDLVELDDDPDNTDRALIRINPVASSNNEYDRNNATSFQANFYLNYDIHTNLRLRVRGAVNNYKARRDRFNNSKTPRGSSLNLSNNLGVNGSVAYRERTNWSNENTLTYRKTFNRDHRLNLLGGLSFQEDKIENFGFSAQDIPNEALIMYGLDEGIPYLSDANGGESALASVFLRTNYSYKSKYLFTATFRADGSSKFSPGNQWGYFPSAAIAWNMDKENFMGALPFISQSKLRLSYGVTGNNRVSNYPTYDRYNSQSVYYSYDNGTPTLGIVPSEIGTQDLKWESTTQLDIGYDLGLFKDRVQFTFDFYKKTTKDLLLYADMPTNTGFRRAYKNIGSLENRGLEFSLSTMNVQSESFAWQSSFNISFNKNKVLALTNNQESMFSIMNISQVNSNLYVSKIGHPAGMFYGYIFDGIYQEEDFDRPSPGAYILKSDLPNNGNPRSSIEPGHIKYKDVNGDHIIDANDMVIMGRGLPIHSGGFSNDFTYKQFHLNVFLQWSYGNQIFNANRVVFEGNARGSFYTNQFASFNDRWTPENRSEELFKVGGEGPNGFPSTRTLEDASYLRIKTVSFGYSVPKRLIRSLHLNDLNFHVSAQNLLTFTNYSGMDPETSVRNSVLTLGYDYSPYPQARTITFGINATF